MRKALVVGIDRYTGIFDLSSCVRDARAVADLLETNGDGSPNFSVKLRLGTGPDQPVRRANLREDLIELFAGKETEVALFYFAGHGHLAPTGGYLRTSDSPSAMEGLSLHEVLTWANLSQVRNRIVTRADSERSRPRECQEVCPAPEIQSDRGGRAGGG